MKTITLKQLILIGLFLVSFLDLNAQSVNGSFDSKYNRYQKNQSFTGSINKNWVDTAWLGDRLHKQIVLWSTKKLTNLNYTVSNLVKGSSIIPSSNISLRFGSYVIGDVEARTCDTPPAYPGTGGSRTKVYLVDALSTTSVSTITTTDPIKIWVTVNIPTSTPIGNYTGTITVKSGTKLQQTFNLNILVTNNILPQVSDWNFKLDIWQFPYSLPAMIQWGSGSVVTPFSSQFYALQKPFYKLLADMGQKQITAYMFDGAFQRGNSMVKWILNSDQTWSFDFTNFDQYVDSLTSWGLTGQINCFSMLGWQTSIGYYDASNLQNLSPNSPRANYTTSPGYNATWTSFLSQFRAHLTQRNLFDRALIFLDEIPTDTMDIVVPIIKSENPNWKIAYAGKYLSPTTEAQVYDYSIILDYETNLHGTQPAGSIKKFYTSCSGTVPNNYITPQNNLAEMTWMAWHAKQSGYNGFLRWAYDFWTNLDPFNAQDGANTAGDFSMAYRSDNTTSTKPVSSIRLELLRDGIQDFEKINIVGSSNSTLNTLINQFSGTSGANALALVQNGQKILKQIAASTINPLAPTILSFTPTSGTSSTSVSITGTNFTGATSVLFNGIAAASFSVISASNITAIVGSGTSGPITVITPNGSANSTTSFTVSGTASYCTVGGGAFAGYYIQNLTTVNANPNINYSTSSYPTGGYIHYTSSTLGAVRGNTFSINLTNSSASNCACTTVWIDWNGNGNFTDAGETVLNGGTLQVCTNPLNYSFNVTVPSSAVVGITRMRVQVKDAWLGLPVSCGITNYTGSADFNINIQ